MVYVTIYATALDGSETHCECVGDWPVSDVLGTHMAGAWKEAFRLRPIEKYDFEARFRHTQWP
jgi:hypothetical protein